VFDEIEMTQKQSYIRLKLHEVYTVRDKDRSESIQRQIIYRARFDRYITSPVDIGGYPYNISRFTYFTFYT